MSAQNLNTIQLTFSVDEITKLTYLDGGTVSNFMQSVNGGTPFIMKTDGGLSMSSTSNLVTMKSYNLKDVEIPGPALSGKLCVHLIFYRRRCILLEHGLRPSCLYDPICSYTFFRFRKGTFILQFEPIRLAGSILNNWNCVD
jgi:hypothetical protein